MSGYGIEATIDEIDAMQSFQTSAAPVGQDHQRHVGMAGLPSEAESWWRLAFGQ
jgi:hypothetical protein